MALTPEQQAAIDRVSNKGAPTALTPAQEAAVNRVRGVAKEREGVAAEVDNVLRQIPGVPTLTDFASGANRSILQTLDFVGPDAINSILEIAGSQNRVPTFTGSAQKVGLGTPTDSIAGKVGEVLPAAMGGGAAMRSAAGQLSPLAAQSESAIRGILRQAGMTKPAADLGYGVAAGVGGAAGQEMGGDAGELIGMFAGTMTGAAGTSLVKKALSNPEMLKRLTQSLASMSDEGASRLLADAMVREGISPDDAAAQLAALGPDAIPADVANGFTRLLRTASNEIPRIQGRAAQVLNERQAGQAGRLASSLDSSLGVPGLNMQDEIERLRVVSAPIINAAYDQAKGTPMALSGRLRTLLTGNNSLGAAFKASQRPIADKRAAGDVVTNFDRIDATKRVLDDQIGVAIRAGENNKARDLVRLKNLMVEEADASVPGYADARALFAGRVALENAADQGTLFLKMNPREVQDITSTMRDSELRMFRLGAKQAILDKVDSIPVGSDAGRRLFGKNGDVEKLRSLFPDQQAFDNFRHTLEREANFSMTRRAAQGNSTTAMQLADMGGADQAMNSARAMAGDPVAAASEFARVLRGLSTKKSKQAYTASLERAGDILLNAGTDPVELQRLLRRGDSPRLRSLLQDALITKPSSTVNAGATAAAAELGAE